MAVPIVTTLGIPVCFVPIVASGITAILWRLWKPVRPLARHDVLAFDPTAQARHVPQATVGFRPPGKSDEFYLNGRASICFGGTGGMLEGAHGHTGIGVLVERKVVDCEVRDVTGLAILHEGALRRPSLCRVVDNLEGTTAHVSAGGTIERHPHRKRTLCHDPYSFLDHAGSHIRSVCLATEYFPSRMAASIPIAPLRSRPHRPHRPDHLPHQFALPVRARLRQRLFQVPPRRA